VVKVLGKDGLRVNGEPFQLTIIVWIVLNGDLGELVCVGTEPARIHDIGEFEAYAVAARGWTDE
jgi:hypothetical protein